MNIYKIIIDKKHSYKIKGDGITRYGDEMIAEIYKKDGNDRFTTIANVNEQSRTIDIIPICKCQRAT